MSRASDPNWRRAAWALLMLLVIIIAWTPAIALWRFFSHFVKF